MMQHENNQKTTAVVIGLASPELIRNQSHGEVKKCETINYRTLKPEPGGIFCQKIFGPVQDYTCNCLKYTRQRHANIVCDRCGVEVTLSKVRRERMGHIELAVPCAHIWFFKALPSKIGNLLDINVSTLERVIYYESYIVTECKINDADAPKAGTIINSEAEYNELLEKYPEGGFTAKMGAEGIYDYIRSLDLEVLAAELRASLSKPRAGSSKNKPVKRGGTSQSKIKLGKRLAIVESFIRSKNKPEWMILTALPVIAADLRPLVPLEGGRFASSDLNDLYRRVIFRNTRLKQLIEDKTPDVIIKNEMRMLQQAVDALLDNQRLQQQVLGAGNRPLKSLSEMLKGKQGRFRQNLLGKRVDYSGRSVIVCGPELKMHQCGLPKFMALILFEPFIIKRLKEAGVVHTVKNAKQMINEGKNELVFKILEDVTKHHVVLLNRAPTLHRLGIQAFEPVLIEGKAIRISPLVTTAFNADFDGDQMAVHVPISIEAQIEARTLMMATDHIQGTMNGQVIHKPSQEQIAGLAWLTLNPLNFQKKTPRFSSVYELYTATAAGNCLGGAPTGGDSLDRSTHALNLHLEIEVMIKDAGERKLIKTTVGRVLFNKIVPQELGFQNYELNKKTIGTLIKKVYDTVGRERTVRFLDNIKDLGFEIATTAGFSMGLQDIVIPPKRESLIEETKKLVDGVKAQYENGHITQREYNSKLIQAWHKCTDAVSEEMMKGLQTPITLFNGTVVPNSLHLMVSSGARGNPQQVRQLGGMRGLMSKANTEIITTPILGNFKMGLNVAECFISCYGARKGLADTALKTADSGYLTRRLVDVAQDNIITMEDCNTPSSIEEVAVMNGTEEIVPLRDKIFGRVAAEDVVDPSDNDLIYVKKGEMITDEISKKIEFSNITSVKVRSVLTCEAPQGVCAKCYGMNLSTGRLVDCGEAVGIIAAQSIGEPGTQLTMRTFHTGGVSSLDMKAETHVQHGGMIVFDENLRYFTSEETGEIIVTGSKGKIYLIDPKEGTPDSCRGRIGEIVTPIETFTPDHGAKVLFKDGEVVKKGDLIIKEDPTNYSFYSEKEGTIEFENLVEGLSCEIREVSKKGEKGHGQTEILVTDNREHLHVQILIQQDEKTVARYMIPAGATIIVAKGARIRKGTVLAKMDRGAITNKDITGGLPQITSLLEARSPKIAAHLAVMDGVIEFTEIQKDKRILSIVQGGHKEELQIPLSAHLIVRDRERVHKGQLLTDGMPVLQELLDISGIRDLYEYIVAEVLKVYALQGVSIAPKHIEIIVRQMLQKVMIKDPGDSTGAVGDLMQINKFKQMNKEIIAEGGKPAIGSPVILGITRAALGTDSFLSAASFQETTRVLTDAAVKRMTDPVISLKACVATATPPPLGANFVTFAKRIRLAEEGRAIVDEDLLAFIET